MDKLPITLNIKKKKKEFYHDFTLRSSGFKSLIMYVLHT